MPFEYKQFYRRKLPHRHSPGTTLFATFRLAGSIPKLVLQAWKAERLLIEKRLSESPNDKYLVEFTRNWFRRFEEILDKAESGPVWLKDERVAQLVFDSVLHRDGNEYDLFAFSIMSNHVHVVFRPTLDARSLVETPNSSPLQFLSSEPTIGVIMQSLKGYTARKANQILGRSGSFWETESYDHEIRSDEEFGRVIKYVLNNPVKAGLVSNWQEWPWSWRRPGQK